MSRICDSVLEEKEEEEEEWRYRTQQGIGKKDEASRERVGGVCALCSRLNRVPCSSYNELWRIGMARGACV